MLHHGISYLNLIGMPPFQTYGTSLIEFDDCPISRQKLGCLHCHVKLPTPMCAFGCWPKHDNGCCITKIYLHHPWLHRSSMIVVGVPCVAFSCHRTIIQPCHRVMKDWSRSRKTMAVNQEKVTALPVLPFRWPLSMGERHPYKMSIKILISYGFIWFQIVSYPSYPCFIILHRGVS